MSSQSTLKSSMKTTTPQKSKAIAAIGEGVSGRTAAGDRTVRLGQTLQVPSKDRTHHSKSGSDKRASSHSSHHSSRHSNSGSHHPYLSTIKPSSGASRSTAPTSTSGAMVPFGNASRASNTGTMSMQPFSMTATVAPRSSTASYSMAPPSSTYGDSRPSTSYGSSMAPYNTYGLSMAPPPRASASGEVEVEYLFSYHVSYKAKGSAERRN